MNYLGNPMPNPCLEQLAAVVDALANEDPALADAIAEMSPDELNAALGGGDNPPAAPQTYARAEKFQRPENYEKIKNVPGGRELWAGANDWEDAWTWAGIHPRNSNGKSEPQRWIHIDHADCPACNGTIDGGGLECRQYAKKRCGQMGAERTQNVRPTAHNPTGGPARGIRG